MPIRILIAYDGSPAADAAVVTAGGLFEARVLTLFNPTMGYEQARRYSFGVDDTTLRRNIEALAAEARESGLEIAEQGAAAAETAGLARDLGCGRATRRRAHRGGLARTQPRGVGAARLGVLRTRAQRRDADARDPGPVS